METIWTVGDELYSVILEKKEGKFRITAREQEYSIEARLVTPHWMSLMVNNRLYNAYIAEGSGRKFISINGEHYTLSLPDEEAALNRGVTGAHGEGRLLIRAPMPGSVLKISVAEKDTVTEGDCLAIVEAMKMETGLHAAVSGVVKRVCVKEGQQVDAGELLIELEEMASGKKED